MVYCDVCKCDREFVKEQYSYYYKCVNCESCFKKDDEV